MSKPLDTQHCPVPNCGCVYHAEENRLCEYAERILSGAKDSVLDGEIAPDGTDVTEIKT